MKRNYFLLLIGIIVFFSCQRNVNEDTAAGSSDNINGRINALLSKPTVTCAGSNTQASINLNICAGSSGAAAGFTVQWITKELYLANRSVWPPDEGLLCKASFSDADGDSRFHLSPNECITVSIGDLVFDNSNSTVCSDELRCNIPYVFRVYANETPASQTSDFSTTLECVTKPCSNAVGCTYSQAYWRNHGPANCNPEGNPNIWPVTSLTLGVHNYSAAQICTILQTPAAGNGLISLAHQLIAAKLNIANGSNGNDAALLILASDLVIGGFHIPPYGPLSLSPASTASFTSFLNNYNLGLTGPGHCE